MNTAEFCRNDNSSSGGIPSRFEGVERNLSVEKIQLNRAFGNDEPVVLDVVVAVVAIVAVCILVVFDFSDE